MTRVVTREVGVSEASSCQLFGGFFEFIRFFIPIRLWGFLHLQKFGVSVWNFFSVFFDKFSLISDLFNSCFVIFL